jgi:hypothetical protein
MNVTLPGAGVGGPAVGDLARMIVPPTTTRRARRCPKHAFAPSASSRPRNDVTSNVTLPGHRHQSCLRRGNLASESSGVNGDPLNLMDPSGHCSLGWGIHIGSSKGNCVSNAVKDVKRFVVHHARGIAIAATTALAGPESGVLLAESISPEARHVTKEIALAAYHHPLQTAAFVATAIATIPIDEGPGEAIDAAELSAFAAEDTAESGVLASTAAPDLAGAPELVGEGDSAAETGDSSSELFSRGAARSNMDMLNNGGGLERSTDTVNSFADRMGIDLQGIDVNIVDNPDDAAYLDLQGAAGQTPSELGGTSFNLGPAAFQDEDTLASTIAHEYFHVLQLQAGVEVSSETVPILEDEAYASEGPALERFYGGAP